MRTPMFIPINVYLLSKKRGESTKPSCTDTSKKDYPSQISFNILMI